ncbi:MAG: aminopeptidase P N-terminal domain-containing protein [Alphaproteobacteria bacterium]|nr:aminopeptidase P N-terminal domain-containing protein [Alphaproteobacteria bacterium]
MPVQPDFAAHKKALLDRLPEGEAVLLFGAPTRLRNGDAEHRYRPDSDVWWLTGWPDPEVAVFVAHGDTPVTMFVQPRDPTAETWTGRRAGPEGARARFGADAAFAYDRLEAELPRLLQGHTALHYAFGVDAEHDALLQASIHKAARSARRNGLDVPETFHAPSKLLHELRLFKLPDEVALLREAGRISAEAHVAAMRAGRPGAAEYEIESAIEHTFRRQGSEGPGYTSIVAAGDNANILHYIVNDCVVAEGDLVLVDAGCEVGHYTADITRTWPANGRFTPPQRRVYQAVLDAQLAAIAAVKPGATFMDVHDTAIRSLTTSMVALGLLEGEVDDLIASEAYKAWYMHGTSHWLGLDVHDVGTYARGGRSRVLEPGMVLTIEPGLYIPAASEDAPADLRGIGIRIEDDVLVTASGCEVLTADAPKTVEALEAVCARAARVA